MIQYMLMITRRRVLFKGVSVYLGEESIESVEKYLRNAKKLGFTRVFTSLHIPEADCVAVIENFEKVARVCTELELHLMVDISNYTFIFMGFSKFISWMDLLKVSVIRVDFGIATDEIVELSKRGTFKVALNASTVSPKNFEELLEKGVNISNIEMSHNFYPRSETGISEEYFLKQTRYFQSNGIIVTAFIPGRSGRRGPIYDGLPTLEEHRKMKASLAFRHLMILGCDGIYFGDNKICEEELADVGSMQEAIALECELLGEESEWIFETIHTDRPDSSEFVIRSQESRLHLSSGGVKSVDIIEPKHCFRRELGSITVDNVEYSRYMGELQIVKISLPADSRVNVIGHILEDNLFLLPYIEEGKQYYFVKRKDY